MAASSKDVTRNVNETTLLSPQLSEDIKALEIPIPVKIEDLFDKQLLDKIDYSSLEICIL